MGINPSEYTRYVMLPVDLVIEISQRSITVLFQDRIEKLPLRVVDQHPNLGCAGNLIIEETYAIERRLDND